MEVHTGVNCLSGYLFTIHKIKKRWRKLKKEGWDRKKKMGKEIKDLRYLEIDKIK